MRSSAHGEVGLGVHLEQRPAKFISAPIAALIRPVGAASALVLAPMAALAEEGAVDWSVEYTADWIGPVAGAPGAKRGYVLDNLSIGATFDMARIAGWSDTVIHAHGLNNSGGEPNIGAGTLQGVDNIEVSRQRARLFEFWIEKAFGGASVRAGLYDLNSEFYANESAGLLIAPAFGIGSELAATGPNGPSIFPSTALAVRAAAELTEHTSVRVAVLNANAGVFGDPGGVDTTFDSGALIIGEWGWRGETNVNVGAWAYTDKQDDIRDTDLGGDPLRRRAGGAYVTLEREMWTNASAFARLGVSDGDTTPYTGGWQAGLLFTNVIASRPESQLSFGAYQGRFATKFRDNLRDEGVDASSAETGLELTYSDQVTSWLRIQPDLQVVIDPAGDRDREEVWVAGIRFAITPFGA